MKMVPNNKGVSLINSNHLSTVQVNLRSQTPVPSSEWMEGVMVFLGYNLVIEGVPIDIAEQYG